MAQRRTIITGPAKYAIVIDYARHHVTFRLGHNTITYQGPDAIAQAMDTVEEITADDGQPTRISEYAGQTTYVWEY